MTAAKKLTTDAAHLEAGSVERVSEIGPTVRLGGAAIEAAVAKSCLVSPEPGDSVLCATTSAGTFVLAVLSGARAETRIAVEDDLVLESRGGAVELRGREGAHVASAGTVSLSAGDLRVRAAKGSVAVQELGFFGRLLQADVGAIAVVAREVDQVVERLSQRAKRVFRFVEETDQTRAGAVDIRAEELLALRSENTVVSARVLTKVDGQQIHIG